MEMSEISTDKREYFCLGIDAAAIGSSALVVYNKIPKYFSPIGIYEHFTKPLYPASKDSVKNFVLSAVLDKDSVKNFMVSSGLDTGKSIVRTMNEPLQRLAAKVGLTVYALSAIDATLTRERRPPEVSLVWGAIGGALIFKFFSESTPSSLHSYTSLGVGIVAGAAFGVMGNLVGQALRSAPKSKMYSLGSDVMSSARDLLVSKIDQLAASCRAARSWFRKPK